MAYAGLMMGCTKAYWSGIVIKIYKAFGTNSFSWSDITHRYPEITKSDLSRLKCSSWICKDKRPILKQTPTGMKAKISKSVMWKLPPEAVTMCQGGYNTIKKKKHTMQRNPCKCEVKK